LTNTIVQYMCIGMSSTRLTSGAFLMPKYNIIIGLTPEDLRKKQAVEMIYTACFCIQSIGREWIKIDGGKLNGI
jgi:hypothetical protein